MKPVQRKTRTWRERVTVTREDIKVEKKSNFNTLKHEMHVSVKIGENTYEVSYSEDKARVHAPRLLIENILKNEIGITEHDIIMQMWKFEEAENEV